MVSKLTLLRLTLDLSLALCVLTLIPFVPTVSSRARLDEDLAQKFLDHQLLQLDARTMSQRVRDTGRLSLVTSDLSFDLELVPNDMRAPGYRAEEFGADGVPRSISIGPVQTFKGRARQTQSGKLTAQSGEARFTINEQKIEGLIITGTERYFVEPARKFSTAATTADYVIYRETDVVTSETLHCGVTLSEQVSKRVADAVISENTTSALTPNQSLQSLQIATEADFEYVSANHGPAGAIHEILGIMNQVQGLFEIQLGLTLKISYQSAWDTPNQPYTSTNPSTLLSEVANFWNANRGTVARDAVHMWTAKELENATLGTAYIEALCRFVGNGRAAYGISRAAPGTQQVAITAHELGHNLGATHPDQQVPKPAACDNTVMNSNVNTTPQLDFCPDSVNEIATYLAGSINCLSGDTSQLNFAVPKSLPVGPIIDAAVGDFNNDGKQDLAAATNDGITVLLGSDNGSMIPTFTHPSGSSPAIGDFDADGKPDLAVANVFSKSVTILRGNGAGGFEPAGNHLVGGFSSRLVAADLNADGRSDLAILIGSFVQVLINSSVGGFEPPVPQPVGVNNPHDLLVGEFTSDNKPDLVVVGQIDTGGGIGPSGAVSILSNTGDGRTFEVSIGPPLSEASSLRIAVGDFNADNITDVVAAVFTSFGDPQDKSHVTILAGDGVGKVQPFGGFQVDFRDARGVAFGDFNGDGHADVAVAGSPSGEALQVHYGKGISPPLITYNVPASAKLASGDFNGDGNSDVVDFSKASIVLGSTTELQAPRRRSFSFPTAIAAGDFNSDGKQDLVVVNAHDPNLLLPAVDGVRVLYGTGTGEFQDPVLVRTLFPVPPRTDVTTGDFNNDGRLDIVLTPATVGEGFTVILANDSGFEAPQTFVANLVPTALTAGDFNADGKLDVAIGISNSGNGEVLLLLGGSNGLANKGLFQPPIGVATIGKSPSDFAAGDFNRDGRLDLAVGYESTNVVSILLGTSGVGFTPLADLTVEAGSRTVTAGDFNFDHKLDLAVGGVSVFPGKGDGTFEQAMKFGNGGNYGVAAADFNGDAKTDIAEASAVFIGGANNISKGGISVLLNITGNSLSAPVNDNFANARELRGPNGSLAGTTVLATKESGEPNHASASNGSGGASIWYSWKAPSTGRFYFQTFSSSFPSVIAVYTGSSVNTLESVAQSTSLASEFVEFDAVKDENYQIAIDGLTGDSGRTVLTWNTGSFKNDNFALAREIRGSGGSVNGDNTGFTLEPNEPSPPGLTATDFSAWYNWKAPNSGKVSFSIAPCGDTTRVLAAYTGNFVDLLAPVAVNFDGYRDADDPELCDSRTLRFNVVAGTTYRIQVRSVTGKPFTLKWNYANPPSNDHFANALILAGDSGSVAGTNTDATKEADEPNHAGGPGGASIWYRWTAQTSGPVTFDVIGFRNQTTNSLRFLKALIAVYTGSTLKTLTPVVADATDNKVTFNAIAGTTYQITIDSGPYAGGGYLPGIVPLHWGTKQVANDIFANAQPLTANGSYVPTLGNNAGATKETGEPNHAGGNGGASVWYRWTALTNGNISFILRPCLTCTLSTNNAAIGVYTGKTVNALTPVPVTTNNHTFTAVRGTTYFIAVDSMSGTGGTFEFSLVSDNISARNDAFANAQVLSGSAGAVSGDNSGATKEFGEPNHTNDIGGASVWYQWKAPASGLYTFDTFGSNFDTLLAVYTGNTVSALSVVASSDNAGSSPQGRLTFDAKLNTTYFIAVDGKSNGVEPGTGLLRSQNGFILLNWNNLPAPLNDNFANTQPLTGESGHITGRNTVATKEGGEPNHAGSPGGVSVWYQWTAPSDGNFTFNTFGSDFNTLLGVYTGSALATLSAASSNDDVGGSRQSRVTFTAVKGTVYYIAVDGSPGVPGDVTVFSGNVVLSWFPETGVSNDNFLSAQQLSGASGSLAGTNAGATKESGEPNHAGDRGGRSVWYSWTAPFSGPALFTTAGSDFDTLLAVYTGANLNALTPAANNDDSPYPDNLGHTLTSSLTFSAVAGTTYMIAVDGSGGRFGNFALRWGREASISGQVSFLANTCGSDKKVTLLLSGEDTRAVTFTGSGNYTFQHLRVGGNYSVRGVSEISASCLPLFLERAHNLFPLAGDVFDANFIDDGLRGGGSTTNITGRVKNKAEVGLDQVAVALTGTASRTVYTDSAGIYVLPNLPPGTYQVTPSKADTVFSPPSMEFTFTSGISLSDVDFTAQESFNIAGQTTDANGAALAGVTISLNNGTQTLSVETGADGFYSFDAPGGRDYTLTAAKMGLNFTPANQTLTSLSSNRKNVDFTVLGSSNLPMLELLLEEGGGSNQAAALDAVLLVRDPFPVLSENNVFNLGTDRHTRVLVFVKNLQLQAGETVMVNLIDSGGVNFGVAAESVLPLPALEFSQISFRLPNGLAPGSCAIQIITPGQMSNSGVIRIKP
jgi:hypothetical protein